MQLTASPRSSPQHRFVPGLGYDCHSPSLSSPPIVSFLRGAARLHCEALHRARLSCAALHRARAAQRACRLAAQRARSLCCPVLPCAARNRTARGTLRAAQGTCARGAARSCTLMTQPTPGAGSPTDDMHSTSTPRGAPPALLPSTPAECPPLSPRGSKSPRQAPPTRSRQPARLASPRQRLKLAGLSRPPAHRATRPARPRLAPSIV